MKKSVYTRPAKPLFVPSRRDVAAALHAATEKPAPAPAAPLIVDRFTECHVTPPAVAGRMAAALGDLTGARILEPSAGNGALVAAVLAAGAERSQVTAVERHIKLWNALQDRFKVDGVDAIAGENECFLEYAECVAGRVSFDRIVMNPPFSKARAHIKAALSLAAPGAVVVALAPATFKDDRAETLERLGPDVFPNAKVFSKIVRFYC